MTKDLKNLVMSIRISEPRLVCCQTSVCLCVFVICIYQKDNRGDTELVIKDGYLSSSIRHILSDMFSSQQKCEQKQKPRGALNL